MTPVGAGAWWDPDDDGASAARPPSDPRVRIGARPLAGGGPGATGDPVHEAALSRWWAVGVVASGALAVTATVIGVLRSDGWWALPAVVSVAAAVMLATAEGRQPRTVSASASGVEVSSRRGTRHVPWERLRRVRGPRELGFARLDTDLEVDTGELVRLPRRTPGGVVEGWRERHHGGRPYPGLPQVWQQSSEERAQQFSLLHNGVLVLGFVAVNLTDAWLVMPLPAFIAAYVAVVGLVAIALSRRPARAVRADEHGLTIPRWRQTHVPWSQVRDVRRKGRYEPQVVVEVSSGQEQEVLGPDLDVVTEWWRLAVPAVDRPPADD